MTSALYRREIEVENDALYQLPGAIVTNEAFIESTLEQSGASGISNSRLHVLTNAHQQHSETPTYSGTHTSLSDAKSAVDELNHAFYQVPNRRRSNEDSESAQPSETRGTDSSSSISSSMSDMFEVPEFSFCLALFLCFLNIIFPGLGTTLAGVFILCGCSDYKSSKCGHCLLHALIGFLQLVLTPLLFLGWISGIIYGVLLVKNSV